MPDSSIAGVILAGGRSRRMGSVAKAHEMLGTKPLIQHVIDRLQPQLGSLVLSVERESADFVRYGLQQIADPEPGSCGPLGGLLSAMRQMDAGCEWMLLVPCDAPFLPRDLAERLKQQAVIAGGEGCAARYQAELQPTFSIWNRSLLPVLESAVVEQGMRGFKQFLKSHPLAVLDWESTDISPFYNINDPDSLTEANRLLQQNMVNK